jgi:hypothetical protein
MPEIRLSETRDLFVQELTFPAECEEVVAACGDVTLQSPGGDNEAIGDVLARCDSETFESTDELVDTVMLWVSNDYVGRVGYDDRGNNPAYDDEVSL